MEVIKASGRKEHFNKAKLCRSMLRAGVSKPIVEKVCAQVEKEIRSDVTTQDLFFLASRDLKKESPVGAAKYNLRRAMMDLGPHGYLFEKYIAQILQAYGYRTELNRHMKGECVTHEVDILAKKEGVHYFVEVKYHNTKGYKSDVQEVMYMYARALDIQAAQERKEGKNAARHEPWLVTNTKFTSKAVQYARCKGIRLTGWRYPKETSLEHLVAGKGLYPITVLPSVNRTVREMLTASGILFAKEVAQMNPDDFHRRFALNNALARRIVRESKELVR